MSPSATGLLDCQARDEKALDFAYNASLAAVNVTKVLRKQRGTPFSIGQIKSLMVNAHFIKRFLYLSIGVIWSDNEIIDNFAVVNQNTESYDNKYTA